jgi:hypothetical protein
MYIKNMLDYIKSQVKHLVSMQNTILKQPFSVLAEMRKRSWMAKNMINISEARTMHHPAS